MPDLLYGSIGPTTARRITALPWFERIIEDSTTLESPIGGM